MHHAFWFLFLLSSNTFAVHLTRNDFVCQEQTSSCYQQIVTQVKTEGQFLQPISENQIIVSRLHGYGSILRLHPERTPIVFLYVHGLWSTEKESNTLAQMVSEYGHVNVLQMTLPGHGYFAEVGEKYTYQDWLQATTEAVQIAKLFGDRIVIGGHSAGATLATMQVQKEQNIFAGLFLIEPAFFANPALTAASCAGKLVIRDVQKLAPLIGRQIDRPLPMSYGCEVGKLAKIFIDEQASQIQASTLFLNNENDLVVQPKKNEEYIGRVDTEILQINFNQNRKMQHGEILGQKNQTLLTQMFCQYLVKQSWISMDLNQYCSNFKTQ